MCSCVVVCVGACTQLPCRWCDKPVLTALPVPSCSVIFLTTSLVFIAKGIPPVRRIISTYGMPLAYCKRVARGTNRVAV